MIWSQASANYQNAIRYGYDNSNLNFKLAQSKNKEGKYKEAINLYNEYLLQNPDDIIAINALNGAIKANEWKEQSNNLYLSAK